MHCYLLIYAYHIFYGNIIKYSEFSDQLLQILLHMHLCGCMHRMQNFVCDVHAFSLCEHVACIKLWLICTTVYHMYINMCLYTYVCMYKPN